MPPELSRWILAALLPVAVLGSGCRSCQSAPSSTDRPLHPALERSAALATPSVSPSGCAVVGAPSVETGTAPLEVHFTAEGMCTDAEGIFTWNFGDGSAPVQEQNPVHVYERPGTYTATVTLADPEHGARDTDEAPITITAP